jgi:hypothetical protein
MRVCVCMWIRLWVGVCMCVFVCGLFVRVVGWVCVCGWEVVCVCGWVGGCVW